MQSRQDNSGTGCKDLSSCCNLLLHFTSIRDPQDEAMHTLFICSINNEAVLKALFKFNDDELTFSQAIQVATEVEEAAKVSKETVYGLCPKLVNKVNTKPQPKNSIQPTVP